jgi:hypothetical protein
MLYVLMFLAGVIVGVVGSVLWALRAAAELDDSRHIKRIPQDQRFPG